jgi:hypothetical protein
LATGTGEIAFPLALVTTFADPPNVALAPLPGAINVTVTPLTGLLFASFTVARRAAGNAVPTTVLCGVPPVAVRLTGVPGVFVRLKLAGVAMPATVAVTVNVPAASFAVSTGAVATPLARVTAVTVSEEPNNPVGPLQGAVNVTVTPLTGLLTESFTMAWRAVENAVFTVALCDVPALMVIVAAVVFVRLKFAPEATPDTFAVTV